MSDTDATKPTAKKSFGWYDSGLVIEKVAKVTTYRLNPPPELQKHPYYQEQMQAQDELVTEVQALRDAAHEKAFSLSEAVEVFKRESIKNFNLLSGTVRTSFPDASEEDQLLIAYLMAAKETSNGRVKEMYTLRDIAEELQVSHETIRRRQKELEETYPHLIRLFAACRQSRNKIESQDCQTSEKQEFLSATDIKDLHATLTSMNDENWEKTRDELLHELSEM